jgi:gluconate 2-dehydrogenase gamma chain
MIIFTILHTLKKLNAGYRLGMNGNEFLHRRFQPETINRRAFFLRSAGFLVTLFLSPVIVRAAKKTSAVLLDDPWQTLAVVQEHIFPSETDSPGAKEINALEYLRNVIKDPVIDSDEKEFILNGVKWLNDLSLEKHKTVFTGLSQSQRADMLQEITKSKAGRNWVSKLLSYILEALLSDPVYGGNPDGIGWKWLEHHPGFPRPPVNKLYWDLLKI